MASARSFAQALGDQGNALEQLGRLKQAKASLREALALRQRLVQGLRAQRALVGLPHSLERGFEQGAYRPRVHQAVVQVKNSNGVVQRHGSTKKG